MRLARRPKESVPLDELQGAASRINAEVTGGRAGIVTSGASAAITPGAAAILARFDLRRMEQLPQCEFPCEFIAPREQRNGYDHAVRAAVAKLIEVGFHEPVEGSGVRRCEAWEIETAIGPNTAVILYVRDVRARPPLAEVVRRACAWPNRCRSMRPGNYRRASICGASLPRAPSGV